MIEDMTQEEREEYGVWLRHNGRNCCQSTVEALTHDDGALTERDRSLLHAVAAGFRAGMGCMEATCGALTGAVMVAGLRKGDAAGGAFAAGLHRRFTELSGASVCKALKAKGPDGHPLCECDDCVRHAIRLAASASTSPANVASGIPAVGA